MKKLILGMIVLGSFSVAAQDLKVGDTINGEVYKKQSLFSKKEEFKIVGTISNIADNSAEISNIFTVDRHYPIEVNNKVKESICESFGMLKPIKYSTRLSQYRFTAFGVESGYGSDGVNASAQSVLDSVTCIQSYKSSEVVEQEELVVINVPHYFLENVKFRPLKKEAAKVCENMGYGDLVEGSLQTEMSLYASTYRADYASIRGNYRKVITSLKCLKL